MIFTPDDQHRPETGDYSLVQLVMRAQAGQQDAFDDLYKQYYKRICDYLTHMIGDNGTACDLAQESFLKAWQNLLRLREPATFRSWLYRIATNLVRDYQRRTRYVRIYSLDAFPADFPSFSSEESLEAVEAQERLKQALAILPWRQRACLILYHLQNIPKDDIADYIGIKKSSTNTYLSTGIKKLRQLLGENM
ncbi:MAG TPA: RNA polymerase sigma factor [Ktedonobacteraceae bacterium]|jgi:RNA polymerase sigma-70 factor (ECF subfamily)